MVILGQEGSSMYPGRKGPVDSQGGRQRKEGECWWSNKAAWEVQPSGRRPGLGTERSVGEGALSEDSHRRGPDQDTSAQ